MAVRLTRFQRDHLRDNTTAAFADIHRYVSQKLRFAQTPFTEAVVASINATTKTVHCQKAGDPNPTNYDYPYLASYTPVIGDNVLIVNNPGFPFILGPLA